MRKSILTSLLTACFLATFAQNSPIQRIDPPNWWVGMASDELELLVYGEGLALQQIDMMPYEGVELLGTTRLKNDNYLFIRLNIAPETKPGRLVFSLTHPTNKASTSFTYELKAREKGEERVQGLTQADVIYLLMPDRFANGDPSNDVIASMQQEIDPADTALYQRRGGDLKGIIDHLDYFDELGVTALWLNPVQENDQPHESYHGYAFTDHYKVDPRLGDVAIYKQLVEACHEKGLKVVMDIVHNHVGDQHWFIRDLPDPTWLNQWDTFTKTTYRAPTLLDPYASAKDKELMSNGWFDTHMPDLNQENEHVARYLIQNNIWWVEHTGLDAYRIDTYAYPSQSFMADWCKAMRKEYPQLTLYGETWVHGVPIQSFFTEKTGYKNSTSHLPAVTDFQLHYALNDALTKDFGWTDGVARLYYTLAKDFVYHDPTRNVVFLDNHDISRFFEVVGKDLNKYKMGVAFLLTTRGIPCLYYGTEYLAGEYFDWDNHEKVRMPFPGGWPGDSVNKFLASGRTEMENEAFNYLQSLLAFRKTSPAIGRGKLMQFVPEKGVYVYFRYHPEQTVMVILNQNKEAQTLSMDRFEERLAGFSAAREVTSGQNISSLNEIEVPATGVMVLELK
ncbi:MAG: glycoside hydrolase family 13 protein [Bacteroidota bacterium]